MPHPTAPTLLDNVVIFPDGSVTWTPETQRVSPPAQQHPYSRTQKLYPLPTIRCWVTITVPAASWRASGGE